MHKREYGVGGVIVLGTVLAWVSFDPEISRGQGGKQNGADLDSLVRGTISRTESLFSGRIEYNLVTGFPGRAPDSREGFFTFSAESWAWHHVGGGRQVSHRGRYIDHVSHLQRDGSVDYTSHVGPARRVDEHHPCPPFFAGTIWYEQTKQYIQKNAANARLTKQAEIDGIKTHVLEWPVSQAGDAFHGVVGSSRLWAPGTLRFYVAPQLGFALPRYEYVDSKGVVAGAFRSSGFKEVAPGVFFPQDCGQESLDEQGRLSYYVRYTIKRTEKMNEAIPDEDFEFVLPKGTNVHDARPANPISFRVGVDPISTADLDAMLIPPKKPSWWTRNWLMACLLGAILATVLLLGYYVVRGRKRVFHPGP